MKQGWVPIALAAMSAMAAVLMPGVAQPAKGAMLLASFWCWGVWLGSTAYAKRRVRLASRDKGEGWPMRRFLLWLEDHPFFHGFFSACCFSAEVDGAASEDC